MKILYIHSNSKDTQFYNDYLNDLNDRSVVQFIHRNVSYLIILLFALWSGAKGPRKTPEACWKTSKSKLSDGVLFISIRQIFDHIFASENKVSEATFSEIS